MKIFTKTTTVRLPSTMFEDLVSLSEVIQKHPSQIVRLAISDLIRHYRNDPDDFADRYVI